MLPSDRFYPNMIPIVGKKFGHLTVLAMAGRTRPYANGQRYAQVLVRCDCGKEYVAQARAVRRTINRCRECAEEDARAAGPLMSRRLPSGKTYYDIAQRTGVPVNTINQRWLRGWAEKDLGLPVVGRLGRRQRRNGRRS